MQSQGFHCLSEGIANYYLVAFLKREKMGKDKKVSFTVEELLRLGHQEHIEILWPVYPLHEYLFNVSSTTRTANQRDTA